MAGGSVEIALDPLKTFKLCLVDNLFDPFIQCFIIAFVRKNVVLFLTI